MTGIDGRQAAIAMLRQLCDDGQLLAAYIEGVVKTGAGQRDTALNLLQAFNRTAGDGRKLLDILENDNTPEGVWPMIVRDKGVG